MAKKSNLIKLGDAINELFREHRLDVRLSQFSVRSGWKEIAGPVIARHTTNIYFNDKTIFVTLGNAALKQEVSYRRQELLDNINRFCGYRLVNEVVIR